MADDRAHREPASSGEALEVMAELLLDDIAADAPPHTRDATVLGLELTDEEADYFTSSGPGRGLGEDGAGRSEAGAHGRLAFASTSVDTSARTAALHSPALTVGAPPVASGGGRTTSAALHEGRVEDLHRVAEEDAQNRSARARFLASEPRRSPRGSRDDDDDGEDPRIVRERELARLVAYEEELERQTLPRDGELARARTSADRISEAWAGHTLWRAVALVWGVALALRLSTWAVEGSRISPVAGDAATAGGPSPAVGEDVAGEDRGRDPSAATVGTDARATLDPSASDPMQEGGEGTGETQDAPELPGHATPASPGSGGGRVMTASRGPRRWSAADWTEGLELPEIVRYTIRRGGTPRTVANLYKIFHHEIETLNPTMPLDRELPPNSRLIVWKRPEGHKSESIGMPGAGELAGGVPMVEGRGRELRMTPWKSFATIETIAAIDLALNTFAARYPQAHPVLVGNLSARKGGRLEPHSSHQSGRDVDLSYMQKWDAKEALNWRTMDARNLDAELTWRLLEILVETGGVEVIYIDTALQKLLYDHAKKHRTVPEAELARWMEYPAGPGGNSRALIQHVKGHVDHLHVRFRCAPGQARCQSRDRAE